MQIGIKNLTSAQKRKLRANKQIRVYAGDGMTINLPDTQCKKCHRNFKKGNGYTVGSGVFEDITNFARNTPFVKTAINEGLKYGKNFAKEKLDEIPMFDGGNLINMRRPINFKTERGTLEGTGIISDILGNINPTLGKISSSIGLGVKKKRKSKGDGLVGDLIGLYNPLYGIAAKAVGLGVAQKKTTPIKGDGFLTDIAGNIAKTAGKALANLAVEKGADFVKSKINNYGKSGSGVKRTCSEKQLAALARGRSMRKGGALFAAGGALLPAGY
jgi:hypothetical protein